MAALTALWDVRTLVTQAQRGAVAERLHHDRGKAVRGRVMPHMQDGLEILASSCHIQDAGLQAGVPPTNLDTVADLCDGVRHIAVAATGLLVTDEHTWSTGVCALEQTHLADAHLQRLVNRRRKVGEIHGLPFDHPTVRRAADATVAILETVAVLHISRPLDDVEGATLSLAQQTARRRLGLLREMQFKVGQAEQLATDHEQLLLKRKAEAHRQRRELMSSPRRDTVAERRAAWRRATAEGRRLEQRARDLAATYTVTSAELRAFGWRGLGRQLTRGAATEDAHCPGYPKSAVRNLFGLMKFIRRHMVEEADPQSIATELQQLIAQERDVRNAVTNLLERWRTHLPDDSQAIGVLWTLHLEETLHFVREHWDEIGWLIADVAPCEHEILGQLCAAGDWPSDHVPVVADVVID